MGLLCIIDSEVNRPEADAIASAMGYADYNVIIGGCNQAADFLSKNVKFVPTHVYVDIGARGLEVLNEIDNLAEYCIETTKVVVVGNTNDLNLYRQLIARGVTEYFVKPLNLSEIRDVLMKQKVETTKAPGAADGKIISFMAAASGDGATTVALNVGYQLAKEYGHRTVILDLDYQYGMVARNLDLVANYGVKELYEHPEGSIDLTMVEKTVTPYKDNLFVIAAPKALRYAPSVTPASIANILETLRMRFKYVIIDLPHVWNEMTVGVLKEVDHNMLVAQLWLKSATHASRLLDCMQFMGVSLNKSSIIINRSGSKFKEAVTANDFAMACKKKINRYISNDSKTIITAENQGKTAIEIGNSVLNKQFQDIVNDIINLKSGYIG